MQRPPERVQRYRVTKYVGRIRKKKASFVSERGLKLIVETAIYFPVFTY